MNLFETVQPLLGIATYTNTSKLSVFHLFVCHLFGVATLLLQGTYTYSTCRYGICANDLYSARGKIELSASAATSTLQHFLCIEIQILLIIVLIREYNGYTTVLYSISGWLILN